MSDQPGKPENDNQQKHKTKQRPSKPAYVRTQKGHSLLLHILLICCGVGLFTIPYYSLSPNHYWHL